MALKDICIIGRINHREFEHSQRANESVLYPVDAVQAFEISRSKK